MENQQKLKFIVEEATPGESSEAEMMEIDNTEEKFVWPWIGIVANIPTEAGNNGRRIGNSGSALRDDLALKGFNPTRVQPVWNYRGHTGFAIVEFNKDFQGFVNAMNFERSYSSENHGKKDWQNGGNLRDQNLYGWVAREDDYNQNGTVGKKTREKRDLKTISQLLQEDEVKMVRLVENMSQSIKKNEILKEELENKVYESSRVVESLKLHNFQLNQTYQAESARMQMEEQRLYNHILMGHEKSMSELETKRVELEERARRINENEAEMEKSRIERELNEKAMWEQNEANKEALKLAEKHQKEKEKLHVKIMEMEAKLNEKQELELEIEKLKGSLNVTKHMVGSDESADMIEQLAADQMKLDAREADLHNRIMALSQKERVTNDEYQEARKEMIQFWKQNDELVKEEKIRLKRMGQLNPEPFLPAVKRKHRLSKEKAEIKAIELCSVWETKIGNVQWHPFKIDESDGTPKRVVDQNDTKLLKLKQMYGEEVYNEVVRTKLEIEEYNASGSYVILELWNYEENRKATMEEATDVMLKIRNDLLAVANKRKKPTLRRS